MNKSDAQKLVAWAELTAEMFDSTTEAVLREVAGDVRRRPQAAEPDRPRREPDLEERLLSGECSQAITDILLKTVLQDHKPGEIVTTDTVCGALGLSTRVRKNVGRRIGRNPEIREHLRKIEGVRRHNCDVYRRKHPEVENDSYKYPEVGNDG